MNEWMNEWTSKNWQIKANNNIPITTLKYVIYELNHISNGWKNKHLQPVTPQTLIASNIPTTYNK